MSKIKVQVILNNKTENKTFSCEANAIIIDNKIKYIDDGVNVVIEKYKDELIINRKSEDYNIVLPLNEKNIKEGKYQINKLGSFDLKINTTKLKIFDNEIEANYIMILDNTSKIEFDFVLKIMEGE